MQRLTKLSVVLSAVAVVMAIAALVGPWWVVGTDSTSHAGTFIGTTEYTPLGPRVAFQTTGLVTVITANSSGYYQELPRTGAIFLATIGLVGLGAVSGALAVFTLVRSEARPGFRKLSSLLGILAFGAAVTAPVLVMLSLPGAANQDIGTLPLAIQFSGFWGSASASRFDLSLSMVWSAGWAWYAAIAAAALFFLASLLVFRERGATVPALASPPASP